MASVTPRTPPANLVGASGDRHLLAAGRTVVGRAPDCGLVLDDGRVSRWHAAIDVDGPMVTVTDLGSTAGTTVAGRPVVGTVACQRGQTITFGPAVFALEGTDTGLDDTGPMPTGRPPLTGRQQQVLAALVAGQTQATIARRLGVSERAISGLCQRLYARLGVASQTEAVAVAVRDGLV